MYPPSYGSQGRPPRLFRSGVFLLLTFIGHQGLGSDVVIGPLHHLGDHGGVRPTFLGLAWGLPTEFLVGDLTLRGCAEPVLWVPESHPSLYAVVGAPIEGEPLIGGVSQGSLNNCQYLSGVSIGCPVSVGPAWVAEDATSTGGVGGIASSTTWLGKRLEGRSCDMGPPSSAKCCGRSAT
ncbi:hypothetical protein BHM03_00009707 [Ensete ventricosum]|nr:hypothetical protein BHM03_00009707 [Ensete ventricosum]